ncbi:MAG TPA: 3-deoxy-manno-octulosonate cytidylyltransferase [Saprospiraceae bacterium]|nr:3-deoxy-manno-octulosonate cytidylyltransferase [Saprospiraceae bacterium]
MPQIIGIIPARYASSRFPGKPLVDIGGKPMIQRVYEQCLKSRQLDQVMVATDDGRIAEAVRNFGGEVAMTSSQHPSGTDRIAEVAKSMAEDTILVNIQGDEPFINPKTIDQLIELMIETAAPIGTAAIPLTDPKAIFDPNVVKVVFSRKQSALYFSRSPIPYQRNVSKESWLEKGQFYKHIGIYAFRQKALQSVSKAEPEALERQESLEQLRWLALGYDIKIVLTDQESIGIDSPEDLKKIKPYIND